MDHLYAIAFGLGVRAVVYKAVGKRSLHLCALIVGLWEGVVLHHFLDLNETLKARTRARSKQVDVYLSMVVRMWVEFIAIQSVEHSVVVLLWSALSYVVADLAPDLWYDTGLRHAVRRAKKDARMVVQIGKDGITGALGLVHWGGEKASPTWARDRLRRRRPSGVSVPRTTPTALSEAGGVEPATLVLRGPPSVGGTGTYPRSILILPSRDVPSVVRPLIPLSGPSVLAQEAVEDDEAEDANNSRLPALPPSREASHEPESMPLTLVVESPYPELPASGQPSPTNTSESFDIVRRLSPQSTGGHSGLTSLDDDQNPWGTEYGTAVDFDDPSRSDPQDIPDEPTPPPPITTTSAPKEAYDQERTPIIQHISLQGHSPGIDEVQPPIAEVPVIPDVSSASDEFVTAIGDEGWVNVHSPEASQVVYAHDGTAPELLSPPPLPMRPWSIGTPLLVPMSMETAVEDNPTELSTVVGPYRQRSIEAPSLRNEKRRTGLFSPPHSPSPPPTFAQATEGQSQPFSHEPSPISPRDLPSDGEFVGGFHFADKRGPPVARAAPQSRHASDSYPSGSSYYTTAEASSSSGTARPLPNPPAHRGAPPTPQDSFTEPEDDFGQHYQPEYHHQYDPRFDHEQQQPFESQYVDGVHQRYPEYQYQEHMDGGGPEFDARYPRYPEDGHHPQHPYPHHDHSQYPSQEDFDARFPPHEADLDSDDSAESEVTVGLPTDPTSPPPISAAKRMKQKLLERGRELREQSDLAYESARALVVEMGVHEREGNHAKALSSRMEGEEIEREARALGSKAGRKIWKAHNPSDMQTLNGAATIRVIGLTPEEALQRTEDALSSVLRDGGNDLRVTVAGGLADYERDPVGKGNERKEYLKAALLRQQLGVQESKYDTKTLIVTFPL